LRYDIRLSSVSVALSYVVIEVVSVESSFTFFVSCLVSRFFIQIKVHLTIIINFSVSTGYS